MFTDILEIEREINSFYAIISGRKDETREWESFKSLFTGRAMLSICGKPNHTISSYSIEEYIARLESFLRSSDFFEYTKSNTFKITGNISMVHNVYEAYEDRRKTRFIKEGNNYVSLVRDGLSWKIQNMLWEDCVK
jgi:hypothetical protein